MTPVELIRAVQIATKMCDPHDFNSYAEAGVILEENSRDLLRALSVLAAVEEQEEWERKNLVPLGLKPLKERAAEIIAAQRKDGE